jgi:hypothetical protein
MRCKFSEGNGIEGDEQSHDHRSASTRTMAFLALSKGSMADPLPACFGQTEEEILAREFGEEPGPQPVCPRFDAEFEVGLASSLNYL